MQTDRYDGMSVDLGPLLESPVGECDPAFRPLEREPLAEHLVPCIATLSRSMDIENLFSKYHWGKRG